MKNKFKDIDSIIFDLDGTLWDSTKGVADSWSEVLSKYNIDKKNVTVEEIKGYMGLTLDEIGRRMLPNMEKDKRDKLLEECGKFENKSLILKGAVIYDNVEATLKELSKKYKLFIVSNCQDGYIESFLDFSNFHKYFVDYECPGRTNLPKANNIKLIIERNNLKQPIYIGDTHLDGESARKANIPFIYAKYGFGKTKEYDYSINKIEELLGL